MLCVLRAVADTSAPGCTNTAESWPLVGGEGAVFVFGAFGRLPHAFFLLCVQMMRRGTGLRRLPAAASQARCIRSAARSFRLKDLFRTVPCQDGQDGGKPASAGYARLRFCLTLLFRAAVRSP